MQRADAYWLAHGIATSAPSWQNATFNVGNLAYIATPGAVPNGATRTWANDNRYALDFARKPYYGQFFPDDEAAGEVYLALGHRASIRSRVAAEIASANHALWNYVDALNMAMPSFARLGVLDSSSADLDAMQALFHYTERGLGLFNEATGLWWRDGSYVGTQTYWSRGNGWAMMALAKVLHVLPPSDPRSAEYRHVFIKMATALVPLQRPDGFWGADLLRPSRYGPEESGTAFFTYAMAWAINAGVLDRAAYAPPVIKAWRALTHVALQPNGIVGYVQGATAGATRPSDGQPVRSTDTCAYGVGGFLMAGAQIAHLQQH